MKQLKNRALSKGHSCVKKDLNKTILSTLILLTISVPTLAQHELTIYGEYRPRAEVRSGYSQPLSKDLAPDLLMMQRVRLGIDYKYKQLIRTKLTIEDARVFGEADQKGAAINNEVKTPNTFIYEAWAELILPKGISLRIGRQSISYDDQRLFSVNDWGNTGSAHDLALLLFKYKGFNANLGYAYNNSQSNPLTSDYNYGTTSFYKNMAYLWLSQKLGEKTGLKITAIAVSTGFQHSKKDEEGKDVYENKYKFTYGGNVEFNKKDLPFGLYATAYGQSGYTNKGIKIGAYMCALKLNYKIIEPLTLFVGVDYYSGTSMSQSADETNTYTGLYGSNHRFNGSMDYWTVATLPKGGCINPYASLQYKICDKVGLIGSYHYFSLAQNIKSSSSKNLGHEIDFDISYKFCKIATIKGGWSCYFKSDLTNIVRGVTGVEEPTKQTETRFAQWAYVSISVTPKFFTYSK
ncbi:MAG: alginate export family protein [Bacteroidales bacterium]